MNAEQVDDLIRAVVRIAHGDVHGPTGLEAVAMSIATADDRSLSTSIGQGLQAVALAVSDLADAVSECAEAVSPS